MAVAVLWAILAGARTSIAEDVAVPVNLQAQLLSKVAEYDRNFVARAGQRAQVLIVTKAGNSDSARIASQMKAALGRLEQVAGLPHEEQVTSYTTPEELVLACKNGRTAILYLGPGFGDDEIQAIRMALDGVDVLSVGAMPQYVPQGIVLGFDLESGRPKLLLHLTQARKQHVALRGEAIKLMRVFE